MSDSDKVNEAEPAALPSRRFEGREDFRQLVRDAFATAAREGWRELVLADATFDDWPLGERAVVDSLQSWAKSGRHCVLLAKRYDAVVRKHPRFVTWRGTWSHIITAVACPSADALELPSAIWSPSWVLERRDLERSNGYCGSEPDRRVALREGLDEWLRKATPAFPATTLGL
ncbi:hypothetical protein LZ009_13950 [Ramlibacter sp. XY19]|uniref:hypothetical protein n=1 Tax=Ramlibacter paludis TaxID=2908000 RepID=UPI0023DC6BB5|nr:hypothetical protein [Ramlibacter paludis]MCG2593883.1 hypothetical protein [Ramlibacter paludis]